MKVDLGPILGTFGFIKPYLEKLEMTDCYFKIYDSDKSLVITIWFKKDIRIQIEQKDNITSTEFSYENEILSQYEFEALIEKLQTLKALDDLYDEYRTIKIGTLVAIEKLMEIKLPTHGGLTKQTGRIIIKKCNELLQEFLSKYFIIDYTSLNDIFMNESVMNILPKLHVYKNKLQNYLEELD